MSLHEEILPAEQHTLLRRLGPVANDLGFLLGGGTAVALHLGHRQSLDLDWFTGREIPDGLELARDVQARGLELTVHSAHRGTLHGSVCGVRVTFLVSRYPLLSQPRAWPECGCGLLALDDLAAMKLLAIAQRGAKKDFLDVFALGQHGLTLDEMLSAYTKKYAVPDPSRVLYSLCYFDDADSQPMPRMLAPVAWDDVKQTIRCWIKEGPAGRGGLRVDSSGGLG
jgi:hypothetical protein